MPRALVCTVQVTGAGSADVPHQAQATGRLAAVSLSASSATRPVSCVRHDGARTLPTSRANGTISDMGRTDTHDLARRLAALPAFSTCRMRDLEDLAAHARHSSVPAGWPLIHEDTPGDACYVLLEGSATVAIAGTPVASVEAGAIVGEMALAQGRLRNATVTSATPLDLVRIDATEFAKLLDRRPALREALLARVNAVAATT
jgi:hypothetical protein